MNDYLLIGELAVATGTTPKALRLYEKCGLIAPAARDGNGYRRYHQGLAADVRLIGMMLALGLTLADIAAILAASKPMCGTSTDAVYRDQMQRAVEAYQRRLDGVDGEIAALLAQKRALEERIAYCTSELASGNRVRIAKPAGARRVARPGHVEYRVDHAPSA